METFRGPAVRRFEFDSFLLKLPATKDTAIGQVQWGLLIGKAIGPRPASVHKRPVTMPSHRAMWDRLARQGLTPAAAAAHPLASMGNLVLDLASTTLAMRTGVKDGLARRAGGDCSPVAELYSHRRLGVEEAAVPRVIAAYAAATVVAWDWAPIGPLAAALLKAALHLQGEIHRPR
jgi:hypothetical protein